MVDLSKILFPYKKKVLESIEFNTFFTIKYWKFAKKVLDSILTGIFFSYRLYREIPKFGSNHTFCWRCTCQAYETLWSARERH